LIIDFFIFIYIYIDVPCVAATKATRISAEIKNNFMTAAD
jgi:hypothetical protein